MDSADIKFVCPKCSRPLIIDSRGVGMHVICPDCKAELTVPAYTGSSSTIVEKTSAGAIGGGQTRISDHSPKYVPTEEKYDEAAVTSMIESLLDTYPHLHRLSAKASALVTAIKKATNRVERLRSVAIAKEGQGGDFSTSLKKELFEVLLYFIDSSLADHKITRNEQDAVFEIRELLGIREEDMYQWGRERLRPLIEAQIDWIQNDDQIDYSEELFLVDLQRIFGLGYDQLRELCAPHVTRLLDNLHLQLSVADRADIRVQIDQLMRSFCMLRYRPPGLANENVDQLASRSIPQSVKDRVWRRDEGKCVKCGSNEKLEFDHIIPFSLGGASTYRNVQLLCEHCNRSKHAKLD